MNKFKTGIIGLGYVGLPRALQFCKKGISVCGLDVDEEKINMLNAGKSYLTNIKSVDIKRYINKKRFYPTSDFSHISELDNIIICLPTPLNRKNEPDLSFLKNTLKKIFKYLKFNQMICLESTSYPGTTLEIFVKPLSKKFNIGQNFFISFSPERNDPGLKIDIDTIPKIVSGYSKKCLLKSAQLYKKIFKELILVDSLEIAEMTKIYENVFRAVNISFVNEMKKICNKMNININNVIDAAKSKPFGFMPFYPGPGLGGHCIPIDPFYLSWKAKKVGIATKFIEISGKINQSIPKWIINKIHHFYFKNKKNLNFQNKKFLILGISYKKNINDMRESPALKLINILLKHNARVEFYDPFFKKIPVTRNYDFSKIKNTKITNQNLKKFDGVILVTDHDNVNYKKIINYSKVIFDTRNKLNNKNYNVINL